jgi:type IX secretion system PorP/SprF family membrane protein
MKNIIRLYILIALLLVCKLSSSQQTSQFSNYLFNGYGINPAYGGWNNCLDIRAGRRDQWVGFENAPEISFISANYTFGKQSFRNYWHSVGFYFEQDKNGWRKSDALYPSYAIHMRITDKYYTSFGVAVGARGQSFNQAIANLGDPALRSFDLIWIIPDIRTGIRFYNKKVFYDFAVQQIYKRKLDGIGGTIGTPSKLTPHYFFTYGREIASSKYYYTYIPSFQVRYSRTLPPSVDATLMMIVKNKTGFGLSYRYNDAIIALLQFKVWKQLNVAIAYEVITSKMRTGASASREYMMGSSSCPSGYNVQGKSNCPAYDM